MRLYQDAVRVEYRQGTSHLQLSEQLSVASEAAIQGCQSAKQRLSRWIVEAIAMAYTSVGLQCPIRVGAHSPRGMASGHFIGDISVAGSWSSSSAFTRFYNLYIPALQAQILSVYLM